MDDAVPDRTGDELTTRYRIAHALVNGVDFDATNHTGAGIAIGGGSASGDG